MDDGLVISAEKNGLDALESKVTAYMERNNISVPEDLREIIEDQICMRQPPKKCRYSRKAGDMISAVIHSVAGAVDSVAGTQLQKKARGCGGCGKRRQRLNQLHTQLSR